MAALSVRWHRRWHARPPKTKAALEKGFDEMLSASGERSDAIFERALLLGAIVITRAVQDPQLSEEILEPLEKNSAATQPANTR